jgi:hypothetical protein
LIGDRDNYPSGTYYKNGWFRFDLSLIPARKNVIGATARLYVVDKNVDQGAYVEGNLYSTDFNESTDTYETLGAYRADNGSRELGGVLTGQYQDFPISLYYNRIYPTLLLSIFATGTPPIYGYMHVSSKETANPPILVITYEDVPPSKPTLNEPIGSFENKSAIIRFSWNYISSVGGSQAKFDLQWSTDQATWTTVNQTTANTYYDMPADTLPAGNIYWRVQTYNEYNEASGYSDIGAFYAIGAPGIPIIQSVTNVTRPVISWSASNQQVYQVQVLQGETILHDSGLQPGIDIRSYKVPVYLNDGNYTAKVRIKNEYDIYSDWGETSFTLTISRPGKPSIALSAVKYGVDIQITYTADKVQIYRSEHGENNFICIGSTDGQTYHDYSVQSGQAYDYFARAFIDEAFTDSDPAAKTATLKYNLFAPVSDLSDIVELKYNLNSIPSKNGMMNPIGASVQLSGRQYPVTIFSEHIDENISLGFAVKTLDELKAVKDLVAKKETVLFRDDLGEKRYGTLSGFSFSRFFGGYTLSFVLSNADYDEEVEG